MAPSKPRVEVTNSGPVVAPSAVEGLYQPFSQADRSRGGHGLGLAIVRSIVNTHSGEISTIARQEGGLAIVVRLPATDPLPAGREDHTGTGLSRNRHSV